jgi:hypothetical protein
MKNRKFNVFFLSLVAILALAFLGKVDACGYVVTLATALFAGNVIQKNEHFITGDKE